LVITELRITPGKAISDGRELVKAMRSLCPAQRIAIHTSDEGLLAAPVPVLRKPYSVEQLLRMLRKPVRRLGQPVKQEE
jgi:hypothetical protein